MSDPAEEIVPVQVLEPRNSELAVREHVEPLNLFGTDDPVSVIRKATEVAAALKDVVDNRRLVEHIQTKQGIKDYPKVEAWTLLGSMLGVFPVTVWTKPTDDGKGQIARVEAVTRAGDVVGAAEAVCSQNEGGRWANAQEYALKGMAQTRAVSRALRQPLGFVMVLAGYEATPEAEMPSEAVKPLPTRDDWGNEAIPAGPKPDGGDRTKASKAQLSKLAILAQDLGWDDVQRRLEAGVESFTDLSKAQASDLIETWQHWVDSARGNDADLGEVSVQNPPADTTPADKPIPHPLPDGPPNDAQWARAHEHIGTDAKILARAQRAYGHTTLDKLTRAELAHLIEDALVGIE